ncbi:MAG TPA: FkbM family methyltransferase [Bacteroidia bacterium]|jgi:FkbM family methyltransferase|nr:FkbM family methyltransferase [Bacteroidia bacterium]
MKAQLKKIYSALPFKKEFYSLLKKVWTPPEKTYRHFHFKGVFTVKIDEDHSFKIRHYGYEVENHIFWTGITGRYESESIKLWIELCKNSTVIVDVGANTGLFSLVAKSLNPHAKVYAFEPVKRVTDKLKANVALNGYDIICIEKALSNFDGEAKIYDTHHEHTYSVTINKNRNLPETPVFETVIPTQRLATFIEQNNIQHINLIKLDVETHEPEVLAGMGEYLERYRPSLLVEILNDEVAARIEPLLKGIPYLYFNIHAVNKPRLVEKLSQSDHYNFLICTRDVAVHLGLINS